MIEADKSGHVRFPGCIFPCTRDRQIAPAPLDRGDFRPGACRGGAAGRLSRPLVADFFCDTDTIALAERDVR